MRPTCVQRHVTSIVALKTKLTRMHSCDSCGRRGRLAIQPTYLFIQRQQIKHGGRHWKCYDLQICVAVCLMLRVKVT